MEITTTQLIYILWILSGLKKSTIADNMNISQCSFSNMMHGKADSMKIDTLKRVFQATNFPFDVEFLGEKLEDFNYYKFTSQHPATFEKQCKTMASLKNV